MNLILLSEQDFVNDDLARVSGRRLEHILKFHKPQLGDKLKTGLLGEKIGRAVVRKISSSYIELKPDFYLDPPEKLPLTLILAMPRPKVFKRILICASSMGVNKIIIIRSWKVDKSYFQSPALQEEAIRLQLILGLEQCVDTILPVVKIYKLFKPFIEDELPFIVKNKLAIVAHPGAESGCSPETYKPGIIAIGPEGGFIPYEIEKFEEAGFQPLNMGKRILKVEHAVPAIIGRLFN